VLGAADSGIDEKASALGIGVAWQTVAEPMRDTRVVLLMEAASGFYRVRGGE